MSDAARLRRDLGLFGAVMLGLGAMVGTGVFVSIGLGAGIAGPMVLVALVLGAALALANGLSSAQLAASHPVSGGTYEYGYEHVNSWAGFTAGWVFLLAKSASAATAALGFAAYALEAAGGGARLVVPLALAAVVLLTAVVLAGIKRTHWMNTVIVSVTLASLAYFVVAGLPSIDASRFSPFISEDANPRSVLVALLEATALMFVAYTGYARIATLGEEVRDPERTIPRAIGMTIGIVMLLYAAVAFVAIGLAGSAGVAAATEGAAAPLAVVASAAGVPGGAVVLAIGAITAMLGVLLNLILGLSRVTLAMARRGDVPRALAALTASRTPRRAVITVALLVAALVLVGNVRTTWSLSAFAVLIYYSLTNLAALRLPAECRLFPRWIAVAGLVACVLLAFLIDPPVLLAGAGAIAVGLVWHAVARRYAARREASSA